MRFPGLSDEEIKKELDRRTGIARPGPKEFLMDALSFAPALLGMPMGMGNVINLKNRFAKPTKAMVTKVKYRPANVTLTPKEFTKRVAEDNHILKHGTKELKEAMFENRRVNTLSSLSEKQIGELIDGIESIKKAAKPVRTTKATFNKVMQRHKTRESISRMEQHYNPDLKNPKVTELPTAGVPKFKTPQQAKLDAAAKGKVIREQLDKLVEFNKKHNVYEDLGLTKGTHFDSPLGKIKYDGFQEGFKDYPGWHTYTLKEGPARGASFGAPSQSLDDITKAAKKVIDNFEGFPKK